MVKNKLIMSTTTSSETAQVFALVMKHLTQFTVAVALVIFACAAVLHATTPAQADHGPQMTQGVGKYQMDLSTILDDSGKTHWYALVWDTETGQSKFYYGNGAKGTVTAGSSYQFPTRPL